MNHDETILVLRAGLLVHTVQHEANFEKDGRQGRGLGPTPPNLYEICLLSEPLISLKRENPFLAAARETNASRCKIFTTKDDTRQSSIESVIHDAPD
jgi:hypothetical protein